MKNLADLADMCPTMQIPKMTQPSVQYCQDIKQTVQIFVQ